PLPSGKARRTEVPPESRRRRSSPRGTSGKPALVGSGAKLPRRSPSSTRFRWRPSLVERPAIDGLGAGGQVADCPTDYYSSTSPKRDHRGAPPRTGPQERPFVAAGP